MPKKHRSYLQTKPQSTAPSSFGSSSSGTVKHGGRESSSSTRSVNDLISRLRIEQNGSIRPENVFSNDSPRSLPPGLRGILSVPLPPPPKPRPGLRPSIYGRSRRTAGPPPPQSWLERSRESRDDAAESHAIVRSINGELRHLPEPRLDLLPGTDFPAYGSLQDVVLRKLAQNWRWHVENDGIYVSELPVILKQKLLSYIAAFAPAADQDGQVALTVLFPKARESGDFYEDPQDEYDDVTRLDLISFTCRPLSRTGLKKMLLFSPSIPTVREAAPIDNTENLESWEDAASDDEGPAETAYSIPTEVKLPLRLRFPKLAHLSLALGTSDIEFQVSPWAALFNVSPYLSTLTSLSIANWPKPTMKSTRRLSPRSSANDRLLAAEWNTEDFSEERSALRVFSSRLYCLKWLDLSGCASWAPALLPTSHASQASLSEDFLEDTLSTIESGPAWNGAWRGLTIVRLAANWVPRAFTVDGLLELDETSIQKLSRGQSESILDTPPPKTSYDTSDLLRHATEPLRFRTSGTLDDSRWANSRLGRAAESGSQSGRSHGQVSKDVIIQDWDTEIERAKYYQRQELRQYVDEIRSLRRVAERVQAVRREGHGKFITFEYGYENS